MVQIPCLNKRWREIHCSATGDVKTSFLTSIMLSCQSSSGTRLLMSYGSALGLYQAVPQQYGKALAAASLAGQCGAGLQRRQGGQTGPPRNEKSCARLVQSISLGRGQGEEKQIYKGSVVWMKANQGKKRKMSETRAKNMKGKHSIREKLKENGKIATKFILLYFPELSLSL